MQDSIRVEKLTALNVVARFNVLHNETLRLADMSEIPLISTTEVNDEVRNILEVYSAVKSKINTIYKTLAIQSSLDLDEETLVDLEVKTERPLRKIIK